MYLTFFNLFFLVSLPGISFAIQLSHKNTFLEHYSSNKPVEFCFSVRKSFSGTYCCAGVCEVCKRMLLNVIIFFRRIQKPDQVWYNNAPSLCYKTGNGRGSETIIYSKEAKSEMVIAWQQNLCLDDSRTPVVVTDD